MSDHSGAPAHPFKQPKAVWAVAFACVISFMGIGLVDPILPSLSAKLHATPSQVELLFTSYLVVTAVAMLVTGWVSSRIGAKRTLLAGLVIIVVFSALAGSAGSIDGIVGFRAGWGLGNALFIATSLAVIVGSASGGFGGAIILYETALGVGIALGPLVGGELGSVSWRGPFFGVTTLMAIALVATLALVEKTPKPRRRESIADPIKALRHRGLLTVSLMALCYNWGFFTVLGYAPFPMRLDTHSLGYVFTAWGVLVAIFAVFVAPRAQQRFGVARTLYVNLALFAVDMVVIAVGTSSRPTLITAVIISGAFIGLNNTVTTQAVMTVAPVERPVASAAYGFVRFIGGGLAPFFAGKMAAAVDVHLPFYVGAGALLLGIVILATGHRLLAAADHAGERPAAAPAATRPVLVAVDDSPLAASVAAAAGRRAVALGAPLRLVHVWETDVAGDAAVDVETGIAAAGAVERRLAELAEQGVTADGQVLHGTGDRGEVGRLLAGVARDLDAAVIVIGAPSHGAVAQIFDESVTARLVREAPCEVVMLRDGELVSAPAGRPSEPAPHGG